MSYQEKPSFYDVLNVPFNASIKEIKTAHRALVKLYHPDKFPLNSNQGKEAEERVKIINAAYETLKDTQKRLVYNRIEKENLRPYSSSDYPQRTTNTFNHYNSINIVDLAPKGNLKSSDKNELIKLFNSAEEGFKEYFGHSFGSTASKDEIYKKAKNNNHSFGEIRKYLEKEKTLFDAMKYRINNDPIFQKLKETLTNNKNEKWNNDLGYF